MKRNGRSHLDKSAYVHVDLGFVLLIFILLFSFAYSASSDRYYSLESELRLMALEADAKDICFILSRSQGFPKNWEENISELKFLGFASENINEGLSFEKLSAFNEQAYLNSLNELNPSHAYTFKIVGVGSKTTYLSYGGLPEQVKYTSSYNCYSYYNSELVSISVEVWR